MRLNYRIGTDRLLDSPL